MFYGNLYVFIIKSAILYLLHLYYISFAYHLSLHKSLIYPPFVNTLYDECNEDFKREYSSDIYAMRN